MFHAPDINRCQLPTADEMHYNNLFTSAKQAYKKLLFAFNVLFAIFGKKTTVFQELFSLNLEDALYPI